MSRKSKSGARCLNVAGAGLILAGLIAMPSLATAADQKIRPDAVESTSGMTVVRDADTGKLRGATPEEHNALQAQKAAKLRSLRIAPAAPQQKWHKSGASGARLTDEMISTSVVTRKADGTLVEQCLDTPEAAEAAVKAAGNSVTKLELE